MKEHANQREGTRGRRSRTHEDSRARRGLTLVEWAVLIAVVSALVLATITAGGSTSTESSVQDTIVVRVRPSQTLWEIASANRLPGQSTAGTVEVILTLNDLDSPSLNTDQLLEVPAASDSVAVASR